ncbi:MAG: hypothetical protein AAF744_11450 [Pseudomonadota bacterium]
MGRTISSLLLALVLALTSQSMAVARGASAATGKIVLCTSTGPMAVYIDAEGEPTAAPHICPDAALHAVVQGPVAAPAQPALTLVAQLADRQRATLDAPAPRLLPQSRAPPVAV